MTSDSTALPDRSAILARLHDKIARGEAIIGGGAGNGLSAKAQEAGGIDLLVIYNSGRYRMAGRGSLAGVLAYGNANDIVREMVPEVVTAVTHTPIVAGVNGTDPFLQLDPFLDDLRRHGIAGVQNFPTVGFIDGNFRRNLEETGMGYALEVELVRVARRHDLLTTPYVFSDDEARAMTEAGADIVVAHLGVTAGGSIGADTVFSLDECVDRVSSWAAAAREVRDDVIVLCHGGPLATPADAAYVVGKADGIDGFYGASSMERLPVEIAIAENVRAFQDALRTEAVRARP
jgi:predicted TIM-barrel enzyme